ncbi:hypothetical protein CJ255_00465 [Candidatus Viridilinea mediisalina]|uniref:Uncharacterized protein n=1 Tax=Candidatus Viridilinea mediisalina TaxID=2024553 RepID=A0A2A6RQA8_9CHLR|nr:hypothetical protein CJ255_00465 [Candidatus Viridilinea mediisalina]
MSHDTFAHALALLRTALADPQAEFRPGQWEVVEKLDSHNPLLYESIHLPHHRAYLLHLF